MTDGTEQVDDEHPRVKRLILGEPLTSEKLDEQLLPKKRALPIFASDALSSVAYAPQELLMILLIGGTAFLAFSPWIAAGVVLLLIVVVASYRQLIRAYPSGGGDYEVARTNLGELPGVVVASALLVDYVLTVAVSVASGVDNIISAIPELDPARVEMAVGFVILIVIVNLRGVREASFAFAVPTYVFIASVAVMIVVGLTRTALGDPPVASSAEFAVQAESLTQAAVILLVLRAFSSGCSALTGVEAVSNGVPAFRAPKVRNAQMTLTLMGGIAILLFSGLVAIALVSGVHYAENPCHLIGFDCESAPQPSLMAQVAAATFGMGSVPFFIIQAATACVLLLAANTAFNGFPLLGAVLARDGFAPKALNTRGDRLVFSNGMVLLGIAAIVVLVVYRANLTTLIQLYIIGVFVSFSIGQIGMVRHWLRVLRQEASSDAAAAASARRERRSAYRGLVINALGAAMTISVLLIVTITKFTHGAWLVFIAIPILATLMIGVNRYYRDVEREIEVDHTTHFGADGDLAIVLVNRLQKPVLKAVDYALAAQHGRAVAVHVAVSDEESAALQRQWEQHRVPMELVIIASPYRSYTAPVAKFIKQYREKFGSAVVTVYLPQYIVGHWWEALLHNRRSRRIAQQLMMVHGVSITLVPWLLDSSQLIYGRRSRPLPGDQRAGRPVPEVERTARRAHRPAGPPEPEPEKRPAEALR
ncbi:MULTISPECIES: APC family permease [unclassified Microbacterium]|uniref:APC family permease n=1 Tax=unclassified Microbacterium TaxID=2609290 RepID=UPI00214C348B|nr:MULTISPECIES: APC family permease [unclassified Microbacterium]MCR2810940.1 APC family permease [Microbacterium sp. zg.B185]WIM19661.1 APC family permease [Microbacterium sp. zg-B185]